MLSGRAVCVLISEGGGLEVKSRAELEREETLVPEE